MSKKKKERVDPMAEKFQAQNWKELSKKQIQNLSPIQRSRYLAYEKPLDEKGIRRCQTRLSDRAKANRLLLQHEQLDKSQFEKTQEERMTVLQGKAYEAQRRVQSVHHYCRSDRAYDIRHLIAMQPSAVNAVRLESLLPPIYNPIQLQETLSKRQRRRIEAIMEDELGIETGRILSSC